MARQPRASKGNLPASITSFVGRRVEAAETRRRLEKSRLVTLTGMGGVGKTRLALKVAEDLARVFEGVWFMELERIADAGEVDRFVLAALGLREYSTTPVRRRIIEHLQDQHVLLVLDNCEHMLTEISRLVFELLQHCPGLKILATSREPLMVPGESVVPVPPLGTPAHPVAEDGASIHDAVQLFEQRAQAAYPAFSVNDANRETVVRICDELDGIPLAIELAASRVRSLAIEQILERLSDRFKVLTSGSRVAHSRQQTLVACIEWSADLCTDDERSLWCRLSVFSGSFDLAAAEYVCSDGVEDVCDTLANLVDKSVVQRENTAFGEARYRLLDTVKAFGFRQLAAPILEHLRYRHLVWCADLAAEAYENWISRRQREWVSRLEHEQANIREALEYSTSTRETVELGFRLAVALHPFWLSRGRLGEGRRWMSLLFHTFGDSTPTSSYVLALCTDSQMASTMGDVGGALTRAVAAAAAARTLRDDALTPQVEHVFGLTRNFTGDYAGAVVSFTDALSGFSGQENVVREEISCLLGIAIANGMLGNVAKAMEAQQQVLRICEENDEDAYRGYALAVHGLAMWSSDPSPARDTLIAGLGHSYEADDALGAAIGVEVLSWIAAASREYERAATLLGAAAALWQLAGPNNVIIPDQQKFHAAAENDARLGLEESRFGGCFTHGAQMDFGECVHYAIDRPAPRSTEPDKKVSVEGSMLTRREMQVAELVAAGKSNKEIAEELVISRRTAEGHVEHVLVKLGFSSRAQIAVWHSQISARAAPDPDS